MESRRKLAGRVLLALLLAGGTLAGNTAFAASRGFQGATSSNNSIIVTASGGVEGAVGADGTAGNLTLLTGQGNVNTIFGGIGANGYGAAARNTITVKGTPELVTIFAYGGMGTDSSADVTANEVTVEGGQFRTGSRVFGGGAAGNKGASGNAAVISGGAFGQLYVVGGAVETGKASDNRVTISGTTISADGAVVIGGYDAAGGSLSGNAVTITEGSFGNSTTVFGGNYNISETAATASGTGSMENNSVSVSGGTFGDTTALFGARSKSGAVTGNKVTVSGGIFGNGSTVTAGSSNTGTVSENETIVSAGTFSGVNGGFVMYKGDATGNAVTIEGGTVTSTVMGGYTTIGNANGNKVTVLGGTFGNPNFEAMARGGYTLKGTASGNSVSISQGMFGGVTAGETAEGDATGNSVTISGGLVTHEVNGGLAESGSATGNKLNISNGIFNRTTVAAGRSSASGTATDNTVEITGGSFDGMMVSGGVSTSEGTASGNKIVVSGGTWQNSGTGSSDITGGFSTKGIAAGNAVTIFGGNLTATKVDGGLAGTDASGNNVTITGGTFTEGFVSGGSTLSHGAASGNVVTVSGADMTGTFLYGGSSSEGESRGNAVTISHGRYTSLWVRGGSSELDSTNNRVTISGGTFAGTSSNRTSIDGGYSDSNAASNNTVTISAGTIDNALIAGGYAQTDAKDNVVNIAGGSISNTNIAGGFSYSGGAETGNIINLLAADGDSVFKDGVALSIADTLNVYGKNYTVSSVEDIKNYNFYIPRNAVANDTMLTVENTTADTFADAKINGGVQPGSHLVKGDKVTLIQAKNGNAIADSATVPEKASLTEGVSRRYDLGLTKDGNKVVATVDNVASKDQTKSLVETRLATMTLINQGSDMLASTGFQQAAAAAEGSRGFEPFFAVSGGKLKADTGSHVDTKGIGMNLGFAKKIDNGAGSLLIGPVVEYGRGSYDSYIDDGIHGSGDSHYWGVGLMAKQTNDNGFYYEGSIRVGKSKADYHTDDMNEHTTHVSYDTEGTYWAAHLDLGKVQEISDKNSMDYYAKYFYSHQASDNVHLSTGEDYRFDSVNSSRIRLGARYLHDFGTANRFYGGLAYQYEFSSSAKAHYDGDSTPSPDVKGSSGLIELGAILKSSKDSPLSVDVGVNGWVGKMKGVTFGVKLGYSF